MLQYSSYLQLMSWEINWWNNLLLAMTSNAGLFADAQTSLEVNGVWVLMTALQSVRTSEGSYSTDCRCCRDLEEVGSISPCDYSIDSMVFVCTLCGRHPRWPTHQYFWCPTLHSSQPGHLFTVALLRGGHGPFRRDCRNQEASRRIGKSMPIIQVASPSQRIQRACFSSTTRQNPCGKCSRSLHRTASGRHGKETKSGSWTR